MQVSHSLDLRTGLEIVLCVRGGVEKTCRRFLNIFCAPEYYASANPAVDPDLLPIGEGWRKKKKSEGWVGCGTGSENLIVLNEKTSAFRALFLLQNKGEPGSLIRSATEIFVSANFNSNLFGPEKETLVHFCSVFRCKRKFDQPF